MGLFKIILDEPKGTNIQPTGNRYIFEIHRNGVLVVNTFRPFEDLHEVTASYRNGAEIPVEGGTAKDTTGVAAAYYQTTVSFDNSTNPVSSSASVVGVKPNAGVNGEDAVDQKNGSIYLPAALESYSYDLDGNLLTDGRWQYACVNLPRLLPV